VATPGRLRLKSQIIARPDPPAIAKPFVRAWVNTGVFHLDQSFDYSVPESISDLVQVGVRVQVPFNGREVEALVLERLDESETAGVIKPISKLLSPHPVATPKSIQLIDAVSKHWATHPFDILRSAIPSRIATIDKRISKQIVRIARDKNSRGIFSFIAFEPYANPADQVILQAARALRDGSVLVIAPDERDIDEICRSADIKKLTYLRLDSSISRAERYENYLRAMNAENTLIVGARSAVFLPISDLSTVIVYKESSHEHYEIRSPGWNVRDVLTLRSNIEKFDLIFTGYVPSLELSALIDAKRLTYITHSHRLAVKAFSSDDGALLPGRIFTDIRSALARGPVLFMIARKGYGNALLCAHCKNLAMCSCGGRLVIGSKNSAPSCIICQSRFPEWSCSWCQRNKQYVAGRGIERAAEEISRAFAGTPIILSYGDVIKAAIESRSAIVISTPGAAPKVNGGYAAVVVLEGLKFFAHSDLRAQERARELFFETAAMINPKGAVLLCIDEVHPIVASVARWNPGAMIRRELGERLEIPLPPFVSSFAISGSAKDFTSIAAGFRKAIIDERIPSSIKVFGPSDIGKAEAKIVLYCPQQDAKTLTFFLHELARKRSIAKRDYLRIRIDPYSL
jgi:primosomal protein N' (replication factor Y)